MRSFAAAMLTALFPAVAMADGPPPDGAMKLSEVIAAVEQRAGVGLAFIDEVEWDDDGYWEVEYYGTDGSEVKVKLDPMTGEPQV